MSEPVRLEMEGRDYLWNGRTWFDAKSYQAPPAVVASRLNARLAPFLAERDAEVRDFHGLLDLAKLARDAGQFERGETAVRRALVLQPRNEPALAVLCSLLRRRGAPERAVAETEDMGEVQYTPLLISRAAALCDLGRWEDAKKTLGRVLARGGSEEAFQVLHRIRASRPDLYPPE